MYKILSKILREATDDSAIHAVILTATGSFFSSGNDFISALANQNEDIINAKIPINIFKRVFSF